MGDVQERPEVAQARAELANAQREGNDEVVRAARKRLAALDVDPDAERKAAAAQRRAAAKADPEPPAAPVGRATKQEGKASRT